MFFLENPKTYVKGNKLHDVQLTVMLANFGCIIVKLIRLTVRFKLEMSDIILSKTIPAFALLEEIKTTKKTNE